MFGQAIYGQMERMPPKGNNMGETHTLKGLKLQTKIDFPFQARGRKLGMIHKAC
jgi:hypothetical protein